jgi:hypothetical protein
MIEIENVSNLKSKNFMGYNEIPNDIGKTNPALVSG